MKKLGLAGIPVVAILIFGACTSAPESGSRLKQPAAQSTASLPRGGSSPSDSSPSQPQVSLPPERGLQRSRDAVNAPKQLLFALTSVSNCTTAHHCGASVPTSNDCGQPIPVHGSGSTNCNAYSSSTYCSRP